MNKQEQFFTMKQNYLFQDLSDAELSHLASISEEMAVSKHAPIFQEGEVENDVYLIISGKVEVTKKDEKLGRLQQIATLEAGELIGEMALIDQSPRSASVYALEDTKLLSLPLAKLSSLAEHKPIYMRIVQNISKQLTHRLRKTNDLTLKVMQSEIEGTKIRLEMERFLFVTLIVLAAWIFLSSVIARYSTQLENTGVISSPVIFFVFLACFYQVKNSAYPLSFYGLSFKNWKRNVLEAIVFSLPILFGAVILKILLIKYIPSLHNDQIFSFHYSSQEELLFPFIYILFTPLQEFIARGCFQSSIEASLSGSHSTFVSILLSSLIFASFHSFVSAEFALIAFVFGLFWGWLYMRQRSIVGCSLSHALIGAWSLTALGYHDILRL